jgi:hypothetical protein
MSSAESLCPKGKETAAVGAAIATGCTFEKYCGKRQG